MRTTILASLFACSLVAACGKGGEEAAPAPTAAPTAAPTPAPSAPPAAAPAPAAQTPADEAKTMFTTVCSTCHGSTGMGDGPAAAALNPKPRNYADAAWQKSVTDEQLAEVILKGGAAVGKSAVMPANPGLADKPEVIKELVKTVRSFGPK